MSTPLPKDPTFWLPAPDNPPPVEERAKNLARHFGLILVVVVVLGAPVLMASLSRGRGGGAAAGLGEVGVALKAFRAPAGDWPSSFAELRTAGPASCPGCGRAWDGWWAYEEWRPEGSAGVRWKDRPPSDAPGEMPAIWCAPCGVVLRADGMVESGTSAAGSAPRAVRGMVPRR